MIQHSNPVLSNQAGIHPDLEIIIEKHLLLPYKKPFQSFSHDIFQQINEIQKKLNLPVILDSGCGTGESTQRLAEEYPDHLVIGIDKSKKRLDKLINDNPVYHENNLIITRAELVDVWRMIKNANWNIVKHYLLYPNPWPKKDQIKRRWYGHPVFPEMTALSEEIELRTNWKTYAEEFKLAFKKVVNKDPYINKIINIDNFISPFEKKYYESGHDLYRVTLE